MGLVVPVLRLFFVFLNIYETFKILKLPRPSPRNNGKPSARAMTQRKRDMKGVMTIWLVWCAYSTYENTLDSVIGIFIPFYDELKSLFLLFFIFTRSRGAEPIYLHIMRPLIKPYTPAVDALLDTAHLIGDFALILLAWPYHAVVARYRRWRAPVEDFVNEDGTNAGQAGTQTRTRPRSRTIYDDSAPTAGLKAQSKTSDVPPEHQIWHPPTPSYEDDETRVKMPQLSVHVRSTSDAPFAPALSPDSEWRKYPDFPSAYPPTPIVQAKNFRIVAPVPKRPSDVINFADISEESDASDGQEDAQSRKGSKPGSIQETQQDFHMSLLEPPESTNPDSDRHSSDENNPMEGVQIVVEDEGGQSEDTLSDEDREEDDEMDIDLSLRTPRRLRDPAEMDMETDEEDEDEVEDSFSLNTPAPRRMALLKAPRAQSMMSVPSTSSWRSRDSHLSTDHYASSLQTREDDEDSDASKVVLDSSRPSDAAPIAGQKRPLPRSHDSQATVTMKVRAQSMMERSSSSGDAKPFPRRGRGGRGAAPTHRVTKTEVEKPETDETDVTGTSDASVVKKRKVIGAADTGPRPRKQAAAAPATSISQRKAPSKDTVPPPARRVSRMAPKNPPPTQAGTSKSKAGVTITDQ